MVVNVANRVHRNLKIIALNTSILNFFAETTNFLLTIKIVQRNKTLLLFYRNLEIINCPVHFKKLVMASVKPLIISQGSYCTL